MHIAADPIPANSGKDGAVLGRPIPAWRKRGCCEDQGRPEEQKPLPPGCPPGSLHATAANSSGRSWEQTKPKAVSRVRTADKARNNLNGHSHPLPALSDEEWTPVCRPQHDNTAVLEEDRDCSRSRRPCLCGTGPAGRFRALCVRDCSACARLSKPGSRRIGSSTECGVYVYVSIHDP